MYLMRMGPRLGNFKVIVEMLAGAGKRKDRAFQNKAKKT